jgi:CBS domain-containing protein
MKKARDIMTPGADWIEDDRTVLHAAQEMAQNHIGAIPICDGQGRLQGMITDRDIVVKVVAMGMDPAATRVRDLADQPEVVTIGADDSVEEAMRTMQEHAVRRLPVIDGTTMIGIVSQADLAQALSDAKAGALVGAISSAPPNN